MAVLPNSENCKLDELIQKTREVVRTKNASIITQGIKEELQLLIQNDCLCLPAELTEPKSDTYARRLVYEDKELGFVIVAMTWGVDQGTPIHDHAGIWCVEGVISGEIDVVSYAVADRQDDRLKLREMEITRSKTGGAGALIPPFEYHVIRNARKDRPSVTLHIYGGNISACGVYRPVENGWYRKEVVQLKYSDLEF